MKAGDGANAAVIIIALVVIVTLAVSNASLPYPPENQIREIIAAKAAAKSPKAFKLKSQQPQIGNAPSGPSESGHTELYVRHDSAQPNRVCGSFMPGTPQCSVMQPSANLDDYKMVAAGSTDPFGVSIHCAGQQPAVYMLNDLGLTPGHRHAFVANGCQDTTRVKLNADGSRQAGYDIEGSMS